MALLGLVLAACALKADDKAYFVTSGGQFGTIDLSTGTATTLGSPVTFPLAGLGQVGGTLYSAGYIGTTLYTVNPASGALNAVGSSIEFSARAPRFQSGRGLPFAGVRRKSTRKAVLAKSEKHGQK